MTFAERVKELRTKRGWTQRYLAQKLGVSRSTIAGYEAPSKSREPSNETLNKLAQLFNVSTDYLLGRTDDPRPPRFLISHHPGMGLMTVRESTAEYRPEEAIPVEDTIFIPVVGVIRCGEPIFAEGAIEEMVALPTMLAQKNDFLLRVKGDSMAPRIVEGDLVLIRPGLDIVNGEIYAVLVENIIPEATLKRVYKTDGQIVLVADNPAYGPMVFSGRKAKDVRVIGKMVRFIGK